LEQLSSLGIEVTHSYGLTETFGPILICQWRPEWDELPLAEQARLKARQGVAHLATVPPRVIDQEGNDVPADGKSIGEIVVRGNVVMRGYYRNHEATVKAAPDGWLRTGDLAVVHPDGYIEIRDRSKDIIISGGENIASIEVEQILASHPAVLEVSPSGRGLALVWEQDGVLVGFGAHAPTPIAPSQFVAMARRLFR
jgi:fatty-acyl-CoA synthase